MSRKFNRQIDLTVFKGEDQSGLNIRDLRIVFEVTKDQLGYPNLAVIDIYNLNRDNQNRVKDVFDRVVLKAGYDEPGIIFLGDIRNVLKVRIGPDLITRIWAGSADRALNEGIMNYTAGANTSVQEVITEAIGSLGGILKGKIDIFPGTNKINGESYSGPTREILDRLKDDYIFNWWISENVFNAILPNSSLNTQQTAVVISSTSGMIGVPALTERGATVKTLLDHNIKVGKLVKIESQTNEVQLGNLFFRNIDRSLGEGVYRAIKITHNGDNRSNAWSSLVEGIRL